jgi:hypothetical protein
LGSKQIGERTKEHSDGTHVGKETQPDRRQGLSLATVKADGACQAHRSLLLADA